MLIVNKPKVASFAKRYLVVFAFAVGGLELARFASGNAEFAVDDLVEAAALFIGLFSSAVLIVSFFRGGIEFRPNEE